MSRRRVVLSCVVLAACGARPVPRAAPVLGGDAVASAGGDVVSSTVAGRVAADRGITPREAVAMLLDDALLAEGARARGFERRSDVEWELVAARARIFADHARNDAVAAGPPTDDEVAALTALHWRDVDRPDAVRVVHVVVRQPKDVAKYPRARELAGRIAKAVADATSADDFVAKANAVDHGEFEVVAEPLPPMTLDGRVTDPGSRAVMDKTFSAAAFALTEPGATSGIVETPFGWHVIRLVERIAGVEKSLEARRELFTAEVVSNRAQKIAEEALQRRGGATTILISSASDALMSHAEEVSRRP